jgi:adenylate kinase family enzyme
MGERVLSCGDTLPVTPARVLVAGTSGSGKTTLAERIAATAGLRHTEIDALYHGPGWTPRDSFVDDVAAIAAQKTWVTEWQYGTVRPLLLSRADLLVWLDLPRTVVIRRVLRRTVTRRLARTELWNGNVEPPLRTFFTDRGHIVRWAWRTHHESALRVAAAMASRADLTVVRLTSQQDVDRWVAGPLVRACCPGGHTGEAGSS